MTAADPPDASRPGRRARIEQWWRGVRDRHPRLDRLSRAWNRYHTRHIEYFALRVILRGLFLAVTTMLIFIYVLGLVTDVLPGDNEITVPTVDVPTETDLGALVQQSVRASEGKVLGIVGAITLLISAYYTGRALREAGTEVFGGQRPKRSRQRIRDALTGLLVAALVLVTWLLALGTAVRTRALVTITGVDLDRTGVNLGKAVLLLGSATLIAAVIYVVLRHHHPSGPRREALSAAVTFGTFATLIDLVLLYAYIGSIIDPRTSSGIVLVLTVLAWVNLAVRGLFLVECWVAEPPVPPA